MKKGPKPKGRAKIEAAKKDELRAGAEELAEQRGEKIVLLHEPRRIVVTASGEAFPVFNRAHERHLRKLVRR